MGTGRRPSNIGCSAPGMVQCCGLQPGLWILLNMISPFVPTAATYCCMFSYASTVGLTLNVLCIPDMHWHRLCQGPSCHACG